MNDNSIFITGYAKLPHGITASSLYSVIVVGVVLDSKTGIVEDVDCSLVTSTAKKLIKDLVVGRNILDYDGIVELLTERYHGSARKALMSAFKIINEKYYNLCNQRDEEA